MLFKILGTGLVTVVLYITIKQYKPELALLVSIAGGLIISLMLISEVEIIIDEFVSFGEVSGLGTSITTPIIKVLGVGYITEFCGEIAEDSGNKLLANKILLGGKISILILALPVIRLLITTIMSILW